MLLARKISNLQRYRKRGKWWAHMPSEYCRGWGFFVQNGRRRQKTGAIATTYDEDSDIMQDARGQVFYENGDGATTGLVEAAFSRLNAQITRFDSVTDCLKSLRTRECHLLLSNPEKPATEGLRLLTESRQTLPSLPVILLVDHGDIPTAVRAMKAGAADCLEKPPQRDHLASVVSAILRDSMENTRLHDNPLSRAEERVLRLILQGRTNPQVATELHRSSRTIEVHRSHIMRKLGVNDMIDLVRRCAKIGILQNWR